MARSDHARQTLSTSTSRDEAKPSFWKRHNRVRRCVANVAGEGQFKTASHAVAVNGHYDRLGRLINRLNPAGTFHSFPYLERVLRTRSEERRVGKGVDVGVRGSGKEIIVMRE